jgi:hypothetical protein
MNTINTTQMEDNDGVLNILESWLTTWVANVNNLVNYYLKTEVYNKTETYNKSEIDANITGQGYITSTNVAYINKTNVFQENQNFSKNITLDGGQINLDGNATIGRSDSATKIWISESGNLITRFSD